MAPPSMPHFVPPTPEGPADGIAFTATAWLTQLPGVGSFGVASPTSTGMLSIWNTFDIEPETPAAFVALSCIVRSPLPGTYVRVST